MIKIKQMNIFAIVSLTTFQGFAFAEQTERVFQLTIKDHKFDKAVIEVRSNEKFQIKVKNADPSFEELESKSLNFEKFLKPGAEATVYLGPLAKGEYAFFADFHQSTGFGKIVVID